MFVSVCECVLCCCYSFHLNNANHHIILSNFKKRLKPVFGNFWNLEILNHQRILYKSGHSLLVSSNKNVYKLITSPTSEANYEDDRLRSCRSNSNTKTNMFITSLSLFFV